MAPNPRTAETIQSSLDAATADPVHGVPGVVFVAVDKHGSQLAANKSGVRSLETKDPITFDTIFWIASCTKLITGIAVMQLVEQGQIGLDDATRVFDLCPELKNAKCLDEQGMLVDREGDITLRMLLTHTAGFGYPFFHEKMRDHGVALGETLESHTNQPLVRQPGTGFDYGISIDYVGLLVERISGLTLDSYFTRNIFEPLGIKDTLFLVGPDMRSRLSSMHWRGEDGKLSVGPHLFNMGQSAESDKDFFNSGGGGGFGSVPNYTKVLATLLNNGKSPTTGNRILSEATVDEMFTNHIQHLPDFARTPIPAAVPMLTNAIPELFPQVGNPAQGWGLTFMITQEAHTETGRGRNAGWWAGLSNLYWWCDRERGVAGMIATQILPFFDKKVVKLWGACEKAVYHGLDAQ